MIPKPQLALWLILTIILAGCTGPRPTATPVVTLPSPTVTASPAPTASPTATPAPTLTPTPATEGQWQCDASTGGVACFGTLTGIVLLSPEEGWAWGGETVLKYALAPGQTQPAWQRVEASAAEIPFRSVIEVGPDEEWVFRGGSIVYYQRGNPQEIPLPQPPARDVVMVNATEGRAVGQGILHYTNK